jgi:hypothetical protein
MSAKEDLSIKKMQARINPATLGAIYSDSHLVRVKRQTAWMRIMFRINRAVKPVLDENQITGIIRVLYFDFSHALWKFLSKYPESVWDRYIKATTDYYEQAHQLRRDVLDKLTDATVKTIKEIFREVGAEKVGSTEIGDSDSSQALGEAGASGTEGRGT